MRTLLLAIWVLAGCSSRFASVTSGAYDCTALVATNTCGVPLATSMKTVELSGGGTDVISLSAPTSAALTAAPDVPWGTVQFGAQIEPLRYLTSGNLRCGSATAILGTQAELTEFGGDWLRLTVLHRYIGATSCVPSGSEPCELTFNVTCSHRN
ncbi:MAG: hypothetical protein JNJ46_20495 [Myxococcales bacterium]|nr:hypothetical protein [Myxococcales bacterium]